MWTISQPKCIIFGKNSAKEFPYIENSLIITSKGAKSRGWLDYLKIKNFQIFDEILPNPSIEIAEKIISNFSSTKIDCVIGIGGGSSMDVAKFVGANLQKKKIECFFFLRSHYHFYNLYTHLFFLKLLQKNTTPEDHLFLLFQ